MVTEEESSNELEEAITNCTEKAIETTEIVYETEDKNKIPANNEEFQTVNQENEDKTEQINEQNKELFSNKTVNSSKTKGEASKTTDPAIPEKTEEHPSQGSRKTRSSANKK